MKERRNTSMPLEPHELDKIATVTLAHYEQHAEEFRAGTCDHDVSQNIASLLRHIEGESPFTILDFGCGPGRDLKTFSGLGHIAIGLEGAAGFAAMARADTGCEVWQQNFLKLDLPGERFDGIFANAALFHVPSQELPRVLRRLHGALKPGGVLFSSNSHGENEEGWNRAAATALTTVLKRGVATCQMRGSQSSSTTTGPSGCRANGSRGWRVHGAGPKQTK
jgi:SAM-dependent methyltransferase